MIDQVITQLNTKLQLITDLCHIGQTISNNVSVIAHVSNSYLCVEPIVCQVFEAIANVFIMLFESRKKDG